MRATLDPARVPLIHADGGEAERRRDRLVDQFIVPQRRPAAGADRARPDAAVANLRKAVPNSPAWLTRPRCRTRRAISASARSCTTKAAVRADVPLSRAEIKQRAEAENEPRARRCTASRGAYGAAAPTPNARARNRSRADRGRAGPRLRRPARARPGGRRGQGGAGQGHRLRAFARPGRVPDDPVKVILMPEFQRGVAVA